VLNFSKDNAAALAKAIEEQDSRTMVKLEESKEETQKQLVAIGERLQVIEGHCGDVDKFLEQNEKDHEEKRQGLADRIEEIKRELIEKAAVLSDKDTSLKREFYAI